MLRFIKQKIFNQLWLSLCLMLGISLLVATFSCRPIFMEGSLNRLLNTLFVQHIETMNEYPTVIGEDGKYFKGDIDSAGTVLDGIREDNEEWESAIQGIPVVSRQTRIRIDFEEARSQYNEKEATMNICYMPEILEHSLIIKGTDYNGDTKSGYLPCMLSEKVMDEKNLIVGEIIRFPGLENDADETARLEIVGVFSEQESKDLFWYMPPNKATSDLYVSMETFDTLLTDYHAERVVYHHATLLDYHQINCGNVDGLISALEQFTDDNDDFYHTMDAFLIEYQQQKQMVSIMLWVMQLPILGMVFAFIYMLSNQIVESERAEIATLKSRGVNRLQVIYLYALRLGFLAVVSALLGIPMGYGFCKLAASTTDFLTFAARDTSTYRFGPEVLLYGGIAAVIGVIFILLPVIKHSKISIVEYHSDYQQSKPMFFEKYFLDVVLLALSLYLLYSSNKSIDTLRMNALTNNKMDPVVFLNACLFIVAAGMVTFRLMHYLVIVIYHIRKKKWKSVSYVAFLQITRTFRKQTFISIFMIMTVAMGLFNANAARTINRNNEDRIRYAIGADVRLEEKWRLYQYSAGNYRYIEPDYAKFENLVNEGYCESVTKVIHYTNANAEVNGQYINHCQVMGIDTRPFGLTAELKAELNTEKHWYESLNILAERTDGVIISRNLAEKYNLDVNDAISIHAVTQAGTSDDTIKCRVKIVDIVDAWPGYEQYNSVDGSDNERYLMVANQATLLQKFEIRPYEIWAKLSTGVSADDLKQCLAQKDIILNSYDSVEARIADMKDSPKIQITNGMFTLSFIIAMGLCAVGFLIYWITSIGRRELLFGVYRAMGMSVRSLNRMLVYEHIFSTLLSVISGGLVGMLTTFLFIKLFSVVHLPEKSNLDIYVYYESADVVKLFAIIAIVIIICLIVLRRLIKKMNITQALKLGED